LGKRSWSVGGRGCGEQLVDPLWPELDALHAVAHTQAAVGQVAGQALSAQLLHRVDEVMLDAHELIDGQAELLDWPVAELHDDEEAEQESVGLVQGVDGVVGFALQVVELGQGQDDAVGVDDLRNIFQLNLLDLLEHVWRNFGVEVVAVEVAGLHENHVLENLLLPLRGFQELLDFRLIQHDFDLFVNVHC
jgi:hypothetical protein